MCVLTIENLLIENLPIENLLPRERLDFFGVSKMCQKCYYKQVRLMLQTMRRQCFKHVSNITDLGLRVI